jgi:hypothetical protein
MATRLFECENCGAFGKITLKGDEHGKGDIVYCPVCSADIYEEEEDYEDKYED